MTPPELPDGTPLGLNAAQARHAGYTVRIDSWPWIAEKDGRWFYIATPESADGLLAD